MATLKVCRRIAFCLGFLGPVSYAFLWGSGTGKFKRALIELSDLGLGF